MPLLIYVTLQANPEHIVSNVQYILRFRNQEKLGGEAGYYLSSLVSPSRLPCLLPAADNLSQMGAIQFIENMDRTTLTITDEEFEKNVEAAVSAIAEKHRLESPPTSATSEKSPLSFGSLGESSRPSMDNDAVAQSSYTPRQSTSSNDDSGEYDEKAAITGLLRTIQKPLSTIGRMFSDSDEPAGSSSNSAPSPAHTPLPPGADGSRRGPGNHSRYSAEEAAARQASAEVAEAQRLHRAEHANIVETLAGMFPDLDKDIISDVVYQKEGRYVQPTTPPLSLAVFFSLSSFISFPGCPVTKNLPQGRSGGRCVPGVVSIRMNPVSRHGGYFDFGSNGGFRSHISISGICEQHRPREEARTHGVIFGNPGFRLMMHYQR